MAQGKVDCKASAASSFRMKDTKTDKCHAVSNAIHRCDGVNDHNKEIMRKNNANNNDENHVKNCHYGEKNKKQSIDDNISSGSLAKGSGKIDKNGIQIKHLLNKTQQFHDGLEERNEVTEFISSSYRRMRYHKSGKKVLEPSLVSKIDEARKKEVVREQAEDLKMKMIAAEQYYD